MERIRASHCKPFSGDPSAKGRYNLPSEIGALRMTYNRSDDSELPRNYYCREIGLVVAGGHSPEIEVIKTPFRCENGHDLALPEIVFASDVVKPITCGKCLAGIR